MQRLKALEAENETLKAQNAELTQKLAEADDDDDAGGKSPKMRPACGDCGTPLSCPSCDAETKALKQKVAELTKERDTAVAEKVAVETKLALAESTLTTEREAAEKAKMDFDKKVEEKAAAIVAANNHEALPTAAAQKTGEDKPAKSGLKGEARIAAAIKADLSR